MTSFYPEWYVNPSEIELLLRIVKCESNFNALAQNKSSSAKGLFQIIDSTWQLAKCKGNPLNAEDNWRCGLIIYKKFGINQWKASEWCWKNSSLIN